MSNVCKLARPLIVRVSSSQSPHPVTLAPVITVASILCPLSAAPWRGPWREAPQGQARLYNKM